MSRSKLMKVLFNVVFTVQNGNINIDYFKFKTLTLMSELIGKSFKL